MLPFLFSMIPTAASATLLMPNPISLAITILIMAITTAILMALLMSSWIAFLLFLIYVGGMMVMFAYFVATSPNFPFNTKIPLILSTVMFFTIFKSLKNFHSQSIPVFSTSLNTFYSLHTTATLMILALILLLTMIIVVKLVSLPKGPLRPFMLYV